MDVQPFGVGVEFFVGGAAGAVDQFIADIEHRGGAVVLENVIHHLDVVVTQGDKADAARHHRYQTAVGEVIGVVVAGGVVEHHRGVAVLGDVFQIVDQEAAGVALRQVGVVFTALDVFDLEAHDVIHRPAVADDGGVGLAHVDAGVGGAHGLRFLHQNVLRLHRVDAVAAAVGAGHVVRGRVALVERRRGAGHVQALRVVVLGDRAAATGPDRAHVAQRAPFDALELEGVAGGVEDGQITHGDAAHVERFQAGDVGAVAERQHGFVLAAALDQHVLGGLDQQALVQIEIAAGEFQGVPGAQLDHGVDHVLGGAFAGLDQKSPALGEAVRFFFLGLVGRR